MTPKPSELLLNNNWKPTRPNVTPRETSWIDPVTGNEFEFILAVLTQLKRDAE